MVFQTGFKLLNMTDRRLVLKPSNVYLYISRMYISQSLRAITHARVNVSVDITRERDILWHVLDIPKRRGGIAIIKDTRNIIVHMQSERGLSRVVHLRYRIGYAQLCLSKCSACCVYVNALELSPFRHTPWVASGEYPSKALVSRDMHPHI